ncbi:hypothetical protein BGW42_005904 [Actinomortierella wolfii]|nr:hypothetical protein BGW42_005904 [Actinomortierella wolfii]
MVCPREKTILSLQEFVSVCGHQDVQGLHRLLKVPTAPGYDALSCLPHELARRVFHFVDAWDLIQLLAVCRSWRRILLRDVTLWKEKLLELVPAESVVVMETLARDYSQAGSEALYAPTYSTGWLKTRHMLSKRSIGEGLDACTSERLRRIAQMSVLAQTVDRPTYKDNLELDTEGRRIQEDYEMQELQTMRWRALLTRELSCQRNWERGQCLGDMFIVSHKEIKPVILAWPYLFVGQGYTGVRVIHLDSLRQHLGSLAKDRQPNNHNQPYYRGNSGGAPGQNSQNTIDFRAIPDSKLFEVPHFMTTLASNQHESAGSDGAPTWGYGLMNSGVGWSDFQSKCMEPLFNLHYNAIAHVAFLKNRFLSINLTGRLLLTSINPESRRAIFAEAQISGHSKVFQVETTDFAKCERVYRNEIVEWEEAIFLGREDGILILDEEARPIYEITNFDNVRKHHSGGKLIQFQVFNDADRQEVLVLYEESIRERRRRVVSIEFEDGFSREISRKELLGDVHSPNSHTNTGQVNDSSNEIIAGSDAEGSSPPATSAPRATLTTSTTTRLSSDPFGCHLPLGRGGDARDSIVMYRDRVGIVSHRYCSFDLGHYCVLQVVNVRTGHGFSTDQNMESKILHKTGMPRRDRGHSHHLPHHGGRHGGGGVISTARTGGPTKHNKWWMLPIDLNDGDHVEDHNQFAALQSEPIIVQGGNLACRILAMDHARIVLGIGANTLRIIWL